MLFMGLTVQPYGKLCYFATWFLINSLFDFVYAINLKNKPWSSMPNSRPMVNAIFPTWELLGSKLVL